MSRRYHEARLVAAGAVGNALEFYDFVVFGYLATHIGAAFFPAGDPVVSILASLGAFAAGMVMRPIGGLLLGGMADRLSRRQALVVSVALIAVPTFLIGLLPGHASIGIAAPILLIGLRMLQGLSLGGEFPTSLIWLIESAPPGRRGFFGSFAGQGATLGMLLGTTVCYATSTALGPQAMAEWGWRLPFLASGALTLLAVLLRRTVLHDEAPRPAAVASPVREVLRNSRGALAGIFFANAATGTTSFVVLMFIVPWLMQTAGLGYSDALALNIETLLLVVFLTPLTGILGDRIGQRRAALIGLGILICGSWGFLRLMQSGDPALDLIGELGLAIGFCLLMTSIGPLMADALPDHTRVTGVALAHGSAVGILGGLAPMVVQWLMHASGDEMAPAHVIMAVSLVSAAALLIAPCFRRPLAAPAAGSVAQPAE